MMFIVASMAATFADSAAAVTTLATPPATTSTVGTFGEPEPLIYVDPASTPPAAGETIGPVMTALPPYVIDYVDVTRFRQPAVTAVPEPAGWAMMVLGFGALGFIFRHRRLPGVRIRFH